MKDPQPTLFDAAPALPDGMIYRAEVISSAEEQALAARLEGLPFKPFEFHGYLGNRRVAPFGWRYDYSRREVRPAAEIPSFLLELRQRAAALAGLAAEDLPQVLATEYAPGAGIGWHRDKPEFDKVVGVSLLSPCTFRLRLRRRRGEGWERATLVAEPRSAYLLDGPSRSEWEHSIPPGEQLRYSVTFRSLRPR